MQNDSQQVPNQNQQSESLDSLEPPAANQPASTQPEQPAKPAKDGKVKRFSIFGNLYLLIFVLLVFVGGGVIYVALKAAKPASTQQKTSSLTDQQISSLQGNTTLVGDSKQTLDIQSNSVFEGQVLDRGDLNVAGSLKVGGPLSLPSVSVGGNGTFGQIGINGGLNVGGDSTLQGALTVQKNLTVSGSGSFGSLNVSTLSITTLQLRGDISVNQHILTTGTQPGRSLGTALGGGGTASVSGTDTAGTVSINTGSNPPAGCFITVNFAKNFGSTPHVVISPSNSSAGSLQFYTNRTSSSFSVCSAGVPSGGTNFVFDYFVLD
jgi:cytoskeletal protein CcmA (bactofilin family)